jgi:hypothetical protein
MYNYSLKLTYNVSLDDDVYRNELMQAFGIQTYNGEIINNVINKEMIPLVKDHFKPIYKTMNEYNKFPFPLDKSVCITLLFGWEYFYLFHLCLGEIKENKITDSITNLISELIKTK